MRLTELRRSPSGFSLTDVLVTIAIVGIFFLSASSVFMLITKNLQVNRVRTLANNLAQERMEVLKRIPYSRLNVTSDDDRDNNGYDTTFYPPEKNIRIGGLNFTRRVLVQRISQTSPTSSFIPVSTTGGGETDVKKITVQVVWREGAQERILTLANATENPERTPLTSAITGQTKYVYAATGAIYSISGIRVEIVDHAGWNTTSSGYPAAYTLKITSGTYTARASRPGFRSQEQTFTVEANKTLPGIDFTLEQIQTGTITGPLVVNDHLVISQVCGNCDNQEWVELYNPTAANWRLDSKFMLVFQNLRNTGSGNNPKFELLPGNNTIACFEPTDPGYSRLKTTSQTPRDPENNSYFIVPSSSYFLIANSARINLPDGTSRDADLEYSGNFIAVNDIDYFTSSNINSLTSKDDTNQAKAGSVTLLAQSPFNPFQASDCVSWASAEAGSIYAQWSKTPLTVESVPVLRVVSPLGPPTLNTIFIQNNFFIMRSNIILVRKDLGDSPISLYLNQPYRKEHGSAWDSDVNGGSGSGLQGDFLTYKIGNITPLYSYANAPLLPKDAPPDLYPFNSDKSVYPASGSPVASYAWSNFGYKTYLSTAVAISDDGFSSPSIIRNDVTNNTKFTHVVATGTRCESFFYVKRDLTGNFLYAARAQVAGIKVEQSKIISIPNQDTNPKSLTDPNVFTQVFHRACIIDRPGDFALVYGYLTNKGKPVEGQTVRSGSEAVSNEEGFYVISVPCSNTTPMLFTITACPSDITVGYQEQTAPVSLSKGDVTKVNFDLAPFGKIYGYVTAPSASTGVRGDKIPNVTVVARDPSSGDIRFSAMSTTDGNPDVPNFEIKDVLTGTYDVEPLLDKSESYTTNNGQKTNAPVRVTVDQGQDKDAGTFTLRSSFAIISGSIRNFIPNGDQALVVASTGSVKGGFPAIPDDLDFKKRLNGHIFYSTAVRPDGSFQLPVRDLGVPYCLTAIVRKSGESRSNSTPIQTVEYTRILDENRIRAGFTTSNINIPEGALP